MAFVDTSLSVKALKRRCQANLGAQRPKYPFRLGTLFYQMKQPNDAVLLRCPLLKNIVDSCEGALGKDCLLLDKFVVLALN